MDTQKNSEKGRLDDRTQFPHGPTQNGCLEARPEWVSGCSVEKEWGWADGYFAVPSCSGRGSRAACPHQHGQGHHVKAPPIQNVSDSPRRLTPRRLQECNQVSARSGPAGARFIAFGRQSPYAPDPQPWPPNPPQRAEPPSRRRSDSDAVNRALRAVRCGIDA